MAKKLRDAVRRKAVYDSAHTQEHHMPAESDKQQRFFGAELARKRAGGATKTKMSEEQLREFARKGRRKGKRGRRRD